VALEEAIKAFDNLWLACDCALGLFKPKTQIQEDWILKLKKFSDKYFEGNLKKTTYCLKDVSNWKLWCDLTREYKTVDYEKMIEEEDFTKPMEELACSGGKCEI